MNATQTMSFEDSIIAETPKLTRFARRRCGKADLADDLVQETLMRALTNRDKFTPGTNIGAWLITILRNTHLNHIRKHKREQVGLNEGWENTQSAPASQEHHLTLVEVSNALDTLSSDHRDVLMSAAVDGKSYEEVAEICECPVGTVRSRLSRARSRLTESLNDLPQAA